MSTKKVFIVTSQGYTATKWIAWALNLHKDIFCEHFLGGEATDDDLTKEELQRHYKRQDRYDSGLETKLFFKRMRRLAKSSEKAYSGNVGGYAAQDLDEILTPNMLKEFRTVNIVRNPIQWVTSGANHKLNECSVENSMKDRVNDGWKENKRLYSKLKVPSDSDIYKKAFCLMCSSLEGLAFEVSLPWARHYRMEDVTSDRSTFVRLLIDITDTNISHTKRYLDKVFNHGAFNHHNPNAPNSSREQYWQWEPWQRRVFKHYAQSFGLIDVYAKLGYDLKKAMQIR